MDWNNWFYYDESSPSFLRWKVDILNSKGRATKIKSGNIAGGVKLDKGRSNRGYYKVKLSGLQYAVHTIIFEILRYEIAEGFVVDHKDGDGTNNSIGNLRCVTKAVNTRNAKRNCLNSSGVAGVSVIKLTTGGYSDTVARAEWYDLHRNKKSRQFSFRKYGEVGALHLAKEAREAAIAALNKLGAGYTKRHGG